MTVTLPCVECSFNFIERILNSLSGVRLPAVSSFHLYFLVGRCGLSPLVSTNGCKLGPSSVLLKRRLHAHVGGIDGGDVHKMDHLLTKYARLPKKLHKARFQHQKGVLSRTYGVGGGLARQGAHKYLNTCSLPINTCSLPISWEVRRQEEFE